MSFTLCTHIEALKNLPGYKPILKSVLKAQIQQLVQQLSEFADEESVFLTASVSDGTLSHIGSQPGRLFLDCHEEIKSKFIKFCIDYESERNLRQGADLERETRQNPGFEGSDQSLVEASNVDINKRNLYSPKVSPSVSKPVSSRASVRGKTKKFLAASVPKQTNRVYISNEKPFRQTTLSFTLLNKTRKDTESSAARSIKNAKTIRNKTSETLELETNYADSDATPQCNKTLIWNDKTKGNIKEIVAEQKKDSENEHSVTDNELMEVLSEKDWQFVDMEELLKEDNYGESEEFGKETSRNRPDRSQNFVDSTVDSSVNAGATRKRKRNDDDNGNDDEMNACDNDVMKHGNDLEHTRPCIKQKSSDSNGESDQDRDCIAIKKNIRYTSDQFAEVDRDVSSDHGGNRSSKGFDTELDYKADSSGEIMVKVEPIWETDDGLEEEKKDLDLSDEPSTSAAESPPKRKSIRLSRDMLCCGDSLVWEKPETPLLKEKRKINCQTLEVKYQALLEVEEGNKGVTKIAKEFKIPISTLCTWVKNGAVIKEQFEKKKFSKKRKSSRLCRHDDVDSALIDWITLMKQQDKSLAVKHVIIKANQLAALLGYTPDAFTCNGSWVDRFRNRHGFTPTFDFKD